MIPKDQWKHFGAPQHYCCADRCLYRRATQVGRFLVSTVARHIQPGKEGFEQIGCRRWGETYVFLLDGANNDCGCPSFRALEIDSLSYSEEDMRSCTVLDAGHEEMCEKWADKQDWQPEEEEEGDEEEDA